MVRRGSHEGGSLNTSETAFSFQAGFPSAKEKRRFLRVQGTPSGWFVMNLFIFFFLVTSNQQPFISILDNYFVI